MQGLDFLKNLALIEEKKAKVSTSVSNRKIETTPTDADLRIFKDGRVYPSAALVQEFDLEYRVKETPANERGNGFDVIDSREFHQYPKEAPAIVFIAAVPKKEAKVDLFGATNYNDDGTPVKSVLDQGAYTKGKEVLNSVCSVYGLDPEKLFVDKTYIDLVIVRDYPVTTPNGIYFIMKKVNRGERKGELEPIRREHLTLLPLVVRGSDLDPNKEVKAETVEEQQAPVAQQEAVVAPEPAVAAPVAVVPEPVVQATPVQAPVQAPAPMPAPAPIPAPAPVVAPAPNPAQVAPAPQPVMNPALSNLADLIG